MSSAVILAGGLGTRLRSAVPDLPKPMALVNGRPFLEHQMRYWVAQGVNHFVLSIGYKYQTIISHFGSKFEGANLEYVIEQLPLGTGGALLMAIEKLDKDKHFLLLNGDTYFSVELNVLTDFAVKNNADWCLSLYRTSESGRYMGVDVEPNGLISSFRSKNICLNKLVNGGVYLVKPSALNLMSFNPGKKISLEDDIFPNAIKLNHKIYGKEFAGQFIDIGIPEDYYRAADMLKIRN
jgi:D-glycero-alpha-D-manno-heptose 1-phosphate guanylyltransferase